MRMLPIAIGLLEIVCCLPAFAQEAVPPPPAPPPTVEAVPAPPAPPPVAATAPATAAAPVAAPVAAPAPAPAPAPAWPLQQIQPLPVGASDAVYPQNDPVEQKRLKRAMRRHERDHERLERVMAVEGNEFSEEKWEAYKNQKAGGIVFIAIGGAGLIATIIYGLKVIVQDATESWCTDSSYDESYDSSTSSTCHDHDGRLGHPAQRVALWTMFITGITGIAVGVPLLVSGSQGKKRQELLRRKDDILAPFDPATATLSLFADPQGGGGLRLKVEF
jgi:hypothetical protein